MACFQCWDDALQFTQALEGLQGLIISHSIVLSTTLITQEAVLRTNARVVQTAGAGGKYMQHNRGL